VSQHLRNDIFREMKKKSKESWVGLSLHSHARVKCNLVQANITKDFALLVTRPKNNHD
jgi:hypothetical protein